MSSLFQSSGYVDDPADKHKLPIDFQRLPAFLRVLLTTDGTVTKSLEAFFWEPIQVHCLSQSVVAHSASNELAMDLDAEEQVVQRSVRLVGLNSAREFASAESSIRLHLLEDDFVTRLTQGRLGVGELLRDLGLETYREILSIGQSENKVWRVYRIVMQHQPFIQVREEFPLQLYK